MSSWATPTSPGSNVPAESPAREHLDEVVRATQRAAELTQQLLAYCGRGAVESRQLDLSREVREMAHPAPDRHLEAGHARVGPRPTCPPVTADPTQLRQIVMNLITNASDALGEASGTITLRTGVARDPAEASSRRTSCSSR